MGWSALLAVVVLGALATGLAFIWMFRVIALAGSVVSASVTYATPLVSTFLGIVVLGEALTWNQPVGAVIVLIGIGGGFIPAVTVLFAATAAAFGRRAVLTDLAIGFVLGTAAYLMFSRLLSLSLPMGPLERLF